MKLEPSGPAAAGKIAGLIGLCKRSGHEAIGFESAVRWIAAGKASLVLLACDLSEKTEKELRYAAREKPADIRRGPLDKEAIGRALGVRKPVGVVALSDSGLAAAVRILCRRDMEEELPYDD